MKSLRHPCSLLPDVARYIGRPLFAPPSANSSRGAVTLSGKFQMIAVLLPTIVAAAGYSLIYMLLGGGLGGAILIFIVAKMLGK